MIEPITSSTRDAVITTNDNLRALAFYQRRGCRLARIIPGTVDAARLQKPSIPVIGEHGILLHDETSLAKSSQPKEKRFFL